MRRREIDLGGGSVRRLLFTLTMPTMTSQLVNLLYNLVDRVYIGHMRPVETVGALALTGVGVCLPIILLVTAFASLMALGGAPRASIEEGGGRREEAERILGNCTTMLLLTAAVLTALQLLLAERLLPLFGAGARTLGYALDYLRIYALGTVFVQLTLGLNAFITAQGFTAVSMQTVLIGAALNVLLDPLFIFALHMGVRGAALATLLSQAASTVWVLRFLLGRRTRWRLRRRFLRLRAKVALPCLALGFSPFIMQGTDGMIAVCFNASLLRYGGELAVGAMTVLTSIRQFVMTPLLSLSQSAQPIISYNFGAHRFDRVREAFRLLLWASMLYSLLLWALVQLFPRAFALVFTSDAEMVAYTARALRIYLGATAIFGIQIVCQQVLIALGNARASLFPSVLRKIVLLLPLLYFLPRILSDGAFAIFLAEPIADVLSVAATALLFAVQFRKALRE